MTEKLQLTKTFAPKIPNQVKNQHCSGTKPDPKFRGSVKIPFRMKTTAIYQPDETQI
jgi:hypothetical protein